MKNIIKKHERAFIIALFLVIICNILNVLQPYIIKQVIDIDFYSENIINKLFSLFLAYLLTHAMFAIMKNVRNIQNNKLMSNILMDIREKIFLKVLKFKMNTYNKYNSSEIYTRLTIDTENLFELFTNFLQIIVNNISYIVIMIIMMFLENVNLALIGLITVGLIAFATVGFTKKIKSLHRIILDKRDEENKELSERYNKNKLTYLFGLQKNNSKIMDKLFYEELKARKKYIFIESFSGPVESVITALGIYAILYYVLNINVSITPGSIYLVLSYIKQCRLPLTEIFSNLEEIQTCLNSFQRIKKLLNEEDEENINIGKNIADLNGDIEFRNVSMKYTEEFVLKNISFVIKKGSKVTIAGKTGAGKSTLTNIFMRLYDISSGQILINGYDIAKISIKSLRDNISYISQTPYIFEDSLKNNITLGNNNISDYEILEIIKKIGGKNIYNRFKEKLDKKIYEKEFSFGELQLISFVRAIVHKANIYIFDEPTSNIDLKTEKLIQNLIDKISQNSTIIIIAHRKSTIQNSDKIIYLKDGEVEAIINKSA